MSSRSKAALLAFALFPTSIFAQGIAVSVNASAPDTTGARFVYAIKEAIRASNGMRLVHGDENSGIQLHIATMNPDNQDQRSSRTIYSITYTAIAFSASKEYLNSSIGVCGENKLRECADLIAADTDQKANEVRQAIMDSVKQRQNKNRNAP